MAWRDSRYPFLFSDELLPRSLRPFRINERCFIRKDHKCGKIFGASKSCFIACPSKDDLEPILGLVSEKLAKVGIESIIAVKERAYGQDIFCTKICGKIIESKFCLVILDDSIEEGKNVPNPNVYYEYGLMTSLHKHIIPLQHQDLKLAFNIQSHDTIKYNPKNVGIELDRAIKDAIRLTEPQAEPATKYALPEKSIYRSFEMAGFDLKESKWFLSEVIDDTGFKGFEHSDTGLLIYLGKLDEEREMQTYLEDLSVVLFRTEKEYLRAEERSKVAKARLGSTEKPSPEVLQDPSVHPLMKQKYERIIETIRQSESEITALERRMSAMSRMYIGFVFDPALNRIQFENKARSLIAGYGRFALSFDEQNEITFGDVRVPLSSPTL